MEDEISACKVVFKPDRKTISVKKGTSVLECLRMTDIPIDAVCGGEGKCGRCKVRLSGSFSSSPSELLSHDERADGVALACTSSVEGDLEVRVLPRSRLGKHQIVTMSVEKKPGKLKPWVRSFSVALPPASLSDPKADLDRLLDALRLRRCEVPLEVLRELPDALRNGRWKVVATLSHMDGVLQLVRVEPGERPGNLFGVAVDIGTTTIVASLVDLSTGTVLATASDYNRQISRGEDVIARMMYSEEHGMDELSHLVRDTINDCIERLISDASRKLGAPVEQDDIVAASLAGNTVMTQLFLGIPTDFLRLEPYVPVSTAFPVTNGRRVGLKANPAGTVLLFPARAGYVGGDIVADILVSGMHKSSGMHLLIDVGTNGEMVLGGKDWMVACSCSAGPAFEGGEVSCGMRAMDGAIDRIRMNEDLSLSYHVLGEIKPVGVCGSGLIDLLAEMYNTGVIDRKARIQDVGSDRIREGDEGMEYVIERKEKLGQEAASDMIITDADLQNILRTKAAIYGACSVLLRKTDESPEDLDSIIIAGGFGYHLDIERAVSLGMFPDVPRKKYRFIGNGSLGGAKLALLSKSARREMLSIMKQMTYLELSVDNEFYEEFTSSLFIPHTDLSVFPSAKANVMRGAQE